MVLLIWSIYICHWMLYWAWSKYTNHVTDLWHTVQSPGVSTLPNLSSVHDMWDPERCGNPTRTVGAFGLFALSYIDAFGLFVLSSLLMQIPSEQYVWTTFLWTTLARTTRWRTSFRFPQFSTLLYSPYPGATVVSTKVESRSWSLFATTCHVPRVSRCLVSRPTHGAELEPCVGQLTRLLSVVRASNY